MYISLFNLIQTIIPFNIFRLSLKLFKLYLIKKYRNYHLFFQNPLFRESFEKNSTYKNRIDLLSIVES